MNKYVNAQYLEGIKNPSEGLKKAIDEFFFYFKRATNIPAAKELMPGMRVKMHCMRTICGKTKKDQRRIIDKPFRKSCKAARKVIKILLNEVKQGKRVDDIPSFKK